MNVQNRRKHRRHEFIDVVAINPMGVSHIIDISSGGISIKCRCEQWHSKTWEIDIVDRTGIYLQGFPVEKVWESMEDKKRYASIFTMTVGVQFKNLSPEQQLALYQLIHK